MKLQLPTSIASAISTIRWPLDPSLCPPLYFQSLESMKEVRLKNPLPTTENAALQELTADIPRSLDRFFLFSDEDSHKEKRQFGMVSMALLLVGNGFTDEAHNIVTPLSWPEDTHFGYGPSMYSEVNPLALSFATYVHCLVHRKEAFNTGEFGMVGFSNANYWSNAVLRSPGFRQLPHQDLRHHVRELVSVYKSNPAVQEWARRHGLESEIHEGESNEYFESRAVHELCANVLRRDKKDDLATFAEHVAETEVLVLLSHALQHAGYECDLEAIVSQKRTKSACTVGDVVDVVSGVDETLALVAANKVSTAHFGIFQSNKAVVLRNVVKAENLSSTSAPSVAAGVANRLLRCPACRLVTHDALLNDGNHDVRKLWIAVPVSKQEADSVESMSGGGSLAPGDVMVVRGCSGAPTAVHCKPWFCVEACFATDEDVFFVENCSVQEAKRQRLWYNGRKELFFNDIRYNITSVMLVGHTRHDRSNVFNIIRIVVVV